MPTPRKPRGVKIEARRARQRREAAAKANITKGVKPKPRMHMRKKYNAEGLRIDGIWFASKAEGQRYKQLKMLEQAGEITDLQFQVKLPIRINNHLITNYVADFSYKVIDDHGRLLRQPIEDVKGMITEVYRLKRAMVMAYHDIKIIEIPAKKVDEWEGRIS
jgi:Protein of unknown function (DUF1064)